MLQETKIQVGKYNINYLKVGHGPHNVLCLPGALGSIWTDFQPQIEGFDREKFCLIVWDAPGYGKSRPPEREFHDDYYAQDVDIALEFMKALNIPKFSLMGWCYGAVTSIILAARYPEAVNKLVAWGARTVIKQHELEFCKQIKNLSLWSERMRKPKLELYGEERLMSLWTKILDVLEGLYNTNDGKILCLEIVENVKCPTFLLQGEKDCIVDSYHVTFLHSNIRGSKIHLYPEGKHNIHLKYAEDFNQRVQEFLLQG